MICMVFFIQSMKKWVQSILLYLTWWAHIKYPYTNHWTIRNVPCNSIFSPSRGAKNRTVVFPKAKEATAYEKFTLSRRTLIKMCLFPALAFWLDVHKKWQIEAFCCNIWGLADCYISHLSYVTCFYCSV